MLRRLLAPFIGKSPIETHSREYRVGQIWQYRTRPGEEQSRLHIAKIETLSGGQSAFHIYLDNLRIPNSQLPGHMQTDLPHAPVSSETLDMSVVKLLGTAATPPDVSEGYAVWREAYDAGEGGIFTISAAEIVEFIEEATRKHFGMQS
jgi:hypothetical protein